MPREFKRTDRVADALQRELADLIREELRDPRLGIANITAVELSKDMSSARVYVNFVGDLADKNQQSGTQPGMDVLNGAAGFLRNQLAKRIRLRIVPRLRFIYDSSGERGQHLSALIDFAVSGGKKRNSSPEAGTSENSFPKNDSPSSSNASGDN